MSIISSMDNEIPIGPNTCQVCGGEYGEHIENCRNALALAEAESENDYCIHCAKGPYRVSDLFLITREVDPYVQFELDEDGPVRACAKCYRRNYGPPCSFFRLDHRNGHDYLRFQPHGYNFPISLPVITHGSRSAANAWTWNGSLEKPTLKPSIKTTHADGKVSHIWLTNGMCQHLSDSTDGLAGQTLPPLELKNIEPETP